ncbi:MAG TPA: prolyl oligopeptidase family serine peptidase [Pyrinomonadaceae bacterium]|nr:prolyl oligopeptidase family serine peptidase [Pyrinomonadaceae bacterium]
MRSIFAVSFALVLICTHLTAQTRTLRPEDLFRLRRVGTTAWAPDGRFVTIEFSRPSRWLDGVPANDLFLLEVKTRTLRPLSSRSAAYIGFFNAVWSPDGQRVAFLSVDRNAVVRAWMWTAGTAAATMVPNVEPRIGLNDPPIAWIDGDHLAVMSWEPGAVRSGPLHVRVLRGRNVAIRWRQAFDGKTASVSVQESPATSGTDAPSVELLTIDLRTGSRKRLARGRIHSLSASPDGCCVSFLRHKQETVAGYFDMAERAGDAEAGYSAVNWGTERHVIDARSGAEVQSTNKPSESQPKPKLPVPPQPDARLLSLAPRNDAALYVANGPSGSQLWLSGGAGRPLTSYFPIWHDNEWMKSIKLGRAERLNYKATDGTALNAWLLLPPDHVPGTRVPVVTIVYPGTVYGVNEPSSFSPYRVNFEHPQLFAALGYAVLLASMPEAKVSSDSHALAPLLNGVIPALDAAIAHGVADPDRIAVLGQSDGGFAVLGLITQTNRFRSAIASAGFSDFNSLYGTFYGQYRHGDSGRPESAQILRMLQTEKGAMSMGGPPWKEPGRYRENSAINRADKVETPLLLIHGELDFIPIQQAEEFFTALYRQDKRVTLLRYAGEGHTIADRANVLDMWQRIEKWLAETMAPRDKNTRR